MNTFKYLAHNADDENWGVFLTVAGSALIEPHSDYPPSGHPNGYHFNWSNGRILQEYQINYITKGEGIIETRKGRLMIREGSVILLKPGQWHRYQPLKQKGWTEHYIGFSGVMADRMIRSTPLIMDNPVLQIGYHESMLRIFQSIFHYARMEQPGYHQICSGLVVQLLGQIISIKRNQNFRQNLMEDAIQKACLIIRDNPTGNIWIENLAKDLQINYSAFRKAFKKYTGLSPMQYHTSLRMKEAEYLLSNSEMSIKEISFHLGFCSVFYFSKLFKSKTGVTPSEYRKTNRDEGPY